MFLVAGLLADFVDQMVFNEEKGLIGIYTRLPPFKWDTPEYDLFKTIRPLTIIIGTLTGLLVFKMILRLRDMTIIIVGILSMSFYALGVGLATASWMIYAALAPGCVHGLLNPLTYAFMARVVEPNEVGKAFAVASVAEQVAAIAQSSILQSIYTATVDWYQARSVARGR
ncbi:Protein C46C11.2 a [Aphelenchoides avenae]|nr:Protein C46C11.2 a [Aphelenchus avenae]